MNDLDRAELSDHFKAHAVGRCLDVPGGACRICEIELGLLSPAATLERINEMMLSGISSRVAENLIAEERLWLRLHREYLGP